MADRGGSVPMLTVDAEHEQLYGPEGATPPDHTMEPASGLSLDTSAYEFHSPWDDGTQPDIIQVFRREDVYEREFDPGIAIHVLDAGSLRVVRGEQFSGLRAGEEVAVAIGRLVQHEDGPALRPFWMAGVTVAA